MIHSLHSLYELYFSGLCLLDQIFTFALDQILDFLENCHERNLIFLKEMVMAIAIGSMAFVHHKRADAVKKQFSWLTKILFGESESSLRSIKDSKKVKHPKGKPEDLKERE